MRRLIYCFILLLTSYACEKDSVLKRKEQAELEKNEWFRNLQIPCNGQSVCQTAVHSAVFRHTIVYYSTLSGALCDPYFSATLYNEEGVIVKTYSGPGDMHIMENEVTDSRIIWRCDQN